MKTRLEQLPDEILLIICQYLSQYHIIRAFFNLNHRLNCTISQFCNSLLASNSYYGHKSTSLELLTIIGRYLQSLTIKTIHLTAAEISLASNIQELTFIQTEVDSIPSLPHLIDLNIINGPSFQSIDVLFLNNVNLHSLYISSSSPLTIPTFSQPRYSPIKQLAVTLRTFTDFLHLLPLCPELTCLNLNLQTIAFSDIDKSTDEFIISNPSTLRMFSLRTNYDVNLNFDDLQTIFKYLPTELEHLAIEIYTEHVVCVDGEQWENYLKEKFPRLQCFEFFILLRKDYPSGIERLRLPDVLKTFQSSYWSFVTPQQITGYYQRSYAGLTMSIHTETIPTVRRRRYFLY